MSDVLDLGNNRLTDVLNPSSQDASTKTYTDNKGTSKLSKSGDVMSGRIDMNLNKITDVADPINAQDVVTKSYLDTSEGGIQKFWVAYGNPFPATDNTIIGLLRLQIIRYWDCSSYR